MNSFKSLFVGLILVPGSAIFLPSCDEGQEHIVSSAEYSVMLPNEVGASIEITIETASDWYVSNSNTWFSVSPSSGSAGTNTLTVTAKDTNPDLGEKVAAFTVSAGFQIDKYYVVQDVASGISVQDTYYISGVEQNYRLVFGSNIENMEISPDVDWATVGELTVIDSTELKDGSISRYKTYAAQLDISRNPGEIRSGSVTITGDDGTSVTTPIVQVEAMDVTYADAFLRSSLVIRFTATWCGWCPCMNQALHDAVAEYPGHIVPMNMFSTSGDLTFDHIAEFEKLYGIQGYPTGIVNSYADVANSQNTSDTQAAFVGVAKDAAENLPSNTAIGGYAEIDGDKLRVVANIASRTAGEYFLSAFILEDGIIAQQSDYAGIVDDPANYEHNSVVRAVVSEAEGTPVSLQDESVSVVVFEVDIPGNVKVRENMHVVLYTTYEGSYSGTFNNGLVTYRNFDYVIDNVADFPVDGTTVEFAYGN